MEPQFKQTPRWWRWLSDDPLGAAIAGGIILVILIGVIDVLVYFITEFRGG